MKNIVISHGGAPTSVINASLAGAVSALQNGGFSGRILGARYGSQGLFAGDFIDLTNLSKLDLEKLCLTPGSAIGSSRFPLYEKEYETIVDNLIKNDVGALLFTGGNGTMDGLGQIYEHALKRNVRLSCLGIPKTIDNDLEVTDHAPGFPSAARYMAATCHDAALDVKGLPIQVVIIEASGRNAGWVAASSALAREKDGDGPHLIYLPELPFDEESFLNDVKIEHEKHGGVLVVASEGLNDKNGDPICKAKNSTSRSAYFGEVAAFLATLVMDKLGIKARGEKPGIIVRCASNLVSEVDRGEAFLMGETAAKGAMEGKTGYMAGIKRISTSPYKIEPILIPIKDVMLLERKLPKEYIASNGHDVTPAFLDWLRPLVGELPEGFSFLTK